MPERKVILNLRERTCLCFGSQHWPGIKTIISRQPLPNDRARAWLLLTRLLSGEATPVRNGERTGNVDMEVTRPSTSTQRTLLTSPSIKSATCTSGSPR